MSGVRADITTRVGTLRAGGAGRGTPGRPYGTRALSVDEIDALAVRIDQIALDDRPDLDYPDLWRHLTDGRPLPTINAYRAYRGYLRPAALPHPRFDERTARQRGPDRGHAHHPRPQGIWFAAHRADIESGSVAAEVHRCGV